MKVKVLVTQPCPRTVAHQAPLAIKFSTQEWVAIPFSMGSVTLENQGIEPRSPADSLPEIRETWMEVNSESEVAQTCLTLCDPIDSSPPGSSVHGIFQARVLEWVAVSSFRGSSPPRD